MNTADEREGLPSASMFERIVMCPGSRLLSQKTPQIESTSEVADFGTRIHAALETGELDELAASEEEVYRKIQDMEAAAESEYLESLPDVDQQQTIHIKEKRFWIKDGSGNKVASVKVDRAMIFFSSGIRHCLLIDAKTGFLSTTHAAANWQLRVGIVALDQAYGPFETARVAIAQYRLKERFTKSDYKRHHLDHAYKEIVFYDSRSKQEDAPMAAGPWCLYCPAGANCSVRAANALLPSVRAQSLDLKKKDVVARVAELSPQDLAFIESKRTAATNLFDAVKQRLKSMTPEQLEEIGLQLVSTGANPTFKDLPKLWQALEPFCSNAEFLSFCDASLGRIKELLVQRIALRDESTLKDAEAKLMGIVEPLITRVEKEKTIKPIIK